MIKLEEKLDSILEVARTCLSCGKSLTKIKRYMGHYQNTKQYSQIDVICANKECLLGIDLKKVENWEEVKS